MPLNLLGRRAHWPYSLASLDLFAGCSPSELAQIGSLLTMLTADAGRTLIREGVAGVEFMVIASGEAVVTVDGQPVARLGAGDFVGEMSLLTRAPRSATVTAVTPLTFYVCNTAEFASLLDAAPSVAAKITETANRRSATNDLQRAA
jgi:CRP-like cAMP-binding protein